MRSGVRGESSPLLLSLTSSFPGPAEAGKSVFEEGMARDRRTVRPEVKSSTRLKEVNVDYFFCGDVFFLFLVKQGVLVKANLQAGEKQNTRHAEHTEHLA